MTDIILDLGSEVNVLTNQTWEQMGRPTLEWSPIQLRLANQQNIVPLGRFPSVPVDIDGVSTLADFEVIEITTTFRPKIRQPYCQIFDTSLLHVRHYDFFKRQWIFVGYPTSFQSVGKATPQFTVG